MTLIGRRFYVHNWTQGTYFQSHCLLASSLLLFLRTHWQDYTICFICILHYDDEFAFKMSRFRKILTSIVFEFGKTFLSFLQLLKKRVYKEIFVAA